MSYFSQLSACELITLANVLSIQLSQYFSAIDLALLGSFLNSLGDNLALIAAADATRIIEDTDSQKDNAC